MVPGRRYTPAIVGRLLWRRRWMIVLPFVVTTAAAATLAVMLPDRYRAETTILVIPQRVPESYVRSTVTSRIEDRLRTISQQILSRTRLERIINEFKLYPDESKAMLMEQLVQHMRDEITLQLVKDDSFRLGFSYNDPTIVARVTDRLASLFIEENLRDREMQAESTSRFLDAQLNDARLRLVEHEKRLETYRQQHSGSLPSQVPSNLQMVQSTHQQITVLNDATNRYRDRLSLIERQIADHEAQLAAGVHPAPPPVQAADPTAVMGGTPLQQLDAARRNLQALQLRLRPEHPDVRRLMRQIAELEATVQAQAPPANGAGAGPAAPAVDVATAAARARIAELQEQRTSLVRQIAAAEAEEVRLRGVVATYQARLEELPTRESELAELTRDYETLQESYRSLLAKREDSVIAANLERRQIGEQFRVIDPAKPPELPYSPNRLLINAIGAALGLLFGFGSAVLLELLDTTIRSDEEVTGALGLATLAVIPFAAVAVAANGQRRRLRLALATAAFIGVAGAAAAWWTLGQGH